MFCEHGANSRRETKISLRVSLWKFQNCIVFSLKRKTYFRLIKHFLCQLQTVPHGHKSKVRDIIPKFKTFRDAIVNEKRMLHYAYHWYTKKNRNFSRSSTLKRKNVAVKIYVYSMSILQDVPPRKYKGLNYHAKSFAFLTL